MAKKITYKDAAKTIRREAWDRRGAFSHNIVTLTLQQVKADLGLDLANKLIKKYNLIFIFGIQTEGESYGK